MHLEEHEIPRADPYALLTPYALSHSNTNSLQLDPLFIYIIYDV